MRLGLLRDLEQRVDGSFDRVLAKQIGTQRVDRADAGDLELGERSLQTAMLDRLDVRGGLAGFLERAAEAELHLARRLLGERHGDDLAERGATCANDGDDAADERRRLPRAGGGLDDQRRVEIVRDAAAGLCVGERLRHGSFRSSLSFSSS